MKRRLVLACSLLAIPFASCSENQEKAEAASTPASGETAVTPTPVTETDRVKLTSSLGDIVIELNREKAPKTVENFLSYVRSGHYDGTVFHRVIDGFMIQGGGFVVDGGGIVEKETKAPIPNEGKNGLKNVRGSIAMARTGDPNSATAQFFINVNDNHGLNFPNPDGHGYAVFGKVVEGMDVVDKIKAVATATKPLTMIGPGGQKITQPAGDVPVEPVAIKAATVLPGSDSGT